MGWFDTFRNDALPAPVTAVAHVVSRKQLHRKAPSQSGWQSEAWQVWEQLGEIHYPTSQIARLVSRLDWNCDPEFDLEAEFADPGLAEISRVLALNLVVGGEAWLTKTGEQWTVYSTATPNLTQKLDETDFMLRVWTPDPRDADKADSGVRAALGPATELLTLHHLSMSQDNSRAASMGFLLRPATRQPMLDDEGNPVDINELIHEAMTAAIEDPSSTAAVVPIDIELPQDEIEAWTHLQFGRPYDENIDRRMERVIRRIALALDIWPELLLGVADINHWGSWFLSEDTWRSSTAPLANQVAQAYETAILEIYGRVITIEPDPAVLLARRSSVRDALNSAWIGAISLKYLREVIGASEDDAPDARDLEIIRLMAGQRRSESRAGITTEEELSTPGSGDQDSIQASIMGAALGDGRGGELSTDFDPDDPIRALGVELVRVDDQLSAWLEGGAEQVIQRARATVGGFLRRKLRGSEDYRSIDLVPNDQAASVFGARTFEVVEVDRLVDDAIAPFVSRWGDMLTQAHTRLEGFLAEVGANYVPDDDFPQRRKRSQELLADLLKAHVTATLTEASPRFVELRAVVTAAGMD